MGLSRHFLFSFSPVGRLATYSIQEVGERPNKIFRELEPTVPCITTADVHLLWLTYYAGLPSQHLKFAQV